MGIVELMLFVDQKNDYLNRSLIFILIKKKHRLTNKI